MQIRLRRFHWFQQTCLHCWSAEMLKNIVSGDSGGSMLVFWEFNWYQVAITSFAHKDNLGGWSHPSVFTKTSLVCDWIATRNVTQCVHFLRDDNYLYEDYEFDMTFANETSTTENNTKARCGWKNDDTDNALDILAHYEISKSFVVLPTLLRLILAFVQLWIVSFETALSLNCYKQLSICNKSFKKCQAAFFKSYT